MDPFGTRLHAAMTAHGPVCAGVDPHASLLAAWGLDDDAAGVRRFSQACVEAWAGEVALVKPQSAFYERHGSRGIAALEEMVAAFREAGTPVLLDVKRGDIGSTAQAYAEAYLDPAAPLAVDAITASPYLGIGSLDPMVDLARAHGAGLFVLALTSNPEAPQVQLARTTVGPTAGTTVAETVLGTLSVLNGAGETGGGTTGALGSFGAVVGATVEPSPALTAALDFGGPVLMPGVGAQGGTVEAVRSLAGDARERVLPSISRELLGAGPDPRALREAVQRSNEQFAAALRG
jgi:orotidine-5'-phosphate decarboxylase